MPLFAHIDCNNFYASCERVFNPSLIGIPVIVLSNNDGCAIARSQEAKDLGIKMGEPLFKIKDLVEKHNISVFSANFELYGDMSNRVMTIASQYSPEVEIYSIDECFLNLEGISDNPRDYCLEIKRKIEKCTKIPVSIGIGSTKSLAKTATRIAKKFQKETQGVHIIDSEKKRIKALKWLKIGDVWGIGRQYSKRLISNNILTAYDFTLLDEKWVKANLTSVGLKLMRDMKGIPSIELETIKEKQSISVTRTFESRKTDFEDIRERVSTFACKCGEKLRKQNSLCTQIHVFIITDYFRQDLSQYSNSINIKLPYPTNSSIDLSKFATMGLEKIYRQGYKYKKAGVVVMDFVPEANFQLTLFENRNPKHIVLMKAVDKMNTHYSQDLIRLACQSPGKTWKMHQDHISQRYTTNINDIIRVKA